MQSELSHEEIARMRQIVQMHDAKRGPMQTIDLNNPPKEPYRFQKFPKMVYDLGKSFDGHLITKIVRSESELSAALEAGYSEQAPAFGQMPEEHLSVALQREVHQAEQALEQAHKRGPGRPPRVTEVA